MSAIPVFGVTALAIEQALQQRLNPAGLEVIDESHLHAGHVGAASGRHFRVRIRSDRFTGLTRIARHRLVYDAVAELIPQGIHALAIEAETA